MAFWRFLGIFEGFPAIFQGCLSLDQTLAASFRGARFWQPAFRHLHRSSSTLGALGGCGSRGLLGFVGFFVKVFCGVLGGVVLVVCGLLDRFLDVFGVVGLGPSFWFRSWMVLFWLLGRLVWVGVGFVFFGWFSLVFLWFRVVLIGFGLVLSGGEFFSWF